MRSRSRTLHHGEQNFSSSPLRTRQQHHQPANAPQIHLDTKYTEDVLVDEPK